jgi:hypothetical protein
MTDPSSGGVLLSVVRLSDLDTSTWRRPRSQQGRLRHKKKTMVEFARPHIVLSRVTPMCLAQTRTELHLDTYITEGFVGLTDSHFEHTNESR